MPTWHKAGFWQVEAHEERVRQRDGRRAPVTEGTDAGGQGSHLGASFPHSEPQDWTDPPRRTLEPAVGGAEKNVYSLAPGRKETGRDGLLETTSSSPPARRVTGGGGGGQSPAGRSCVREEMLGWETPLSCQLYKKSISKF